MKGIIFNLVEQVVADAHGEDTWDDLLVAAGVDGVYTAVGQYPDEELDAIVAAAATALDTDHQGVLAWVGRRALPLLAARYPTFFDPPDAASFVQTLNDVIHPEVRKLHPGATTPVFDFTPVDDHTLDLLYRSHRRMCGFAEGLTLGAGDHYGEPVEVVHRSCKLEGDGNCVLRVTFAQGGVGAP